MSDDYEPATCSCCDEDTRCEFGADRKLPCRATNLHAHSNCIKLTPISFEHAA